MFLSSFPSSWLIRSRFHRDQLAGTRFLSLLSLSLGVLPWVLPLVLPLVLVLFARNLPTKMSGPRFVNRSSHRQRRGQCAAFPGRGSLGQIQPCVSGIFQLTVGWHLSTGGYCDAIYQYASENRVFVY